MRLRSTLPLMAAGLMLSTPVFAQKTPDAIAPAPQQPVGAPAPMAGLRGQQMSNVTQSSRIRAFNAGPDGEVRSLYLQNGSVVNVSPDLGQQISAQNHKGLRVKVTGASSTINGQRIITANSITMNSQTYTSQLRGGPQDRPDLRADSGPLAGPDGRRGNMPPPPEPPPLGPGSPRGPRPGRGDAPAPPPIGPDARRAGERGAPPPPPNPGAPVPPPNGVGQGSVPPPPPSGSVGQPGLPSPVPAQTPGMNPSSPTP